MLCDNNDDLKIIFSLVFFNLNVAKLKNLTLLLNRYQSLCQKGFVCVLIKLSYKACSSMLDLKIIFSLVFFNLNVAKLKNLRLLLNRCQSSKHVAS